MPEKNSLICPSCGKLISNYVDECPYCRLKNPSKKHLLTSLLSPIRKDIKRIIIGMNIGLLTIAYIIPFFLPVSVPNGRDFLGLLPSPSAISLNLLGWADIRLILEGRWWVLITAVFLHGGFLHILFNMLWIRDLSPNVISIFGPYGLITIFVFSGIIGNLVAISTPVILNLALSTSYPYAPVVGASGAVFGFMGSLVAFGRRRGGFFGRQIVRQLGMWALIMIVMGFLFPGISNAAHIGGFIGGFIIGKILPVNGNPYQRGWVFWVAVVTIVLTVLSFIFMVIRMVTIISSL